MAWTEHSRFALGLFAMLAPFDLMPVFIGLTARMTLRGRLATATIACAYALSRSVAMISCSRWRQSPGPG